RCRRGRSSCGGDPRRCPRVNATIRTVELHLAVPFEISRAKHTSKKVVLVELEEGDRISRGEGVPDAFFGETAESVERDIHDGLSLLPEDPEDIASLGARLDERFPHGGAACCAIDILAHDRASLAAGVPLRNLLGLAPAEPPPTSFTVGIDEPELMAGRAANAAVMGFAILKVKLGRGDDVAILRAIRERFTGTIRVDPIEAAHDRGLKVMLGCRAAETSVAIAAAAHLAPAVDWCDLDGNLLITDDPFRAVTVKRGRFVFPSRPGLGAIPAA